MGPPSPNSAQSRMLPFAGFGMGFGFGFGCGTGLGLGIGGHEISKVRGFGGFGGCGIGGGFGYGWFVAGIGMPYKRLSDELGITDKRVQKRYEQQEQERQEQIRRQGYANSLPGEQEYQDEDTVLDERLKEVMISIERRREQMRQRRERMMKNMF